MADIIETDVRRRPGGPQAKGGAFGAADRHSRRVRFLKIAVPGLAALGLVGFLAFAWLNPFARQDINVDVGKLNVSGDRLTMELPRLTGFNKRQQSYNVTAKTASQRLTAPGLIDLTDLEAVISMPGDDKATLRAVNGKFDSGAELLTLHDNVTVASTKGYSAALAAATVDFKAGTVKSDEPVKVNLQSGIVVAGSLSVSGGGDVIIFNKGVSTRFETNSAKQSGRGMPKLKPESRGSTQ